MKIPRALFVTLVPMPTWCSAFALIPPKSARRNGQTTVLNYANDYLPVALRPFDLNGDGKLDEKDLQIFQNNIVQALDLNGDGELNEKDALRAFQLVVLSWALTVSPAAAKGGGHGGGGHGGGSHASFHSHEPYYAPYRRTWLVGRNSKYDKPWNPMACYDMPGEGEQVEVLVPIETGEISYAPGVVIQAKEQTCAFSVQVGQPNSDSDSAVRSFQTMRNWGNLLLPLYFAACVGAEAVKGVTLSVQAQQQDKLFDEEFSRQLACEVHIHPVPTSGKYTGSTQESDGANQAINVKLHFDEETRKITGIGYDSQDGKYSLDGEWIEDKVKWTERYHREGFSVDVRGHLNEDSTKLDCRFVSSRNVRGTFKLRKKRNVGI